MNQSSDWQSPIDVLAEEFLARHRNGESPAIDEYVEKHPALADEIREVFPALLMMEKVNPGSVDLTSAVRRPPDMPQPPPLKQVGDYQIIREIARGGMGIVYEAEQQSLGRRVALKILPLRGGDDDVLLTRFHREARAAARLHHTNIVPVFEVGQHSNVWFYAMQFIRGQSLDQVFVELQRLPRVSCWTSKLTFWPSVR